MASSDDQTNNKDDVQVPAGLSQAKASQGTGSEQENSAHKGPEFDTRNDETVKPTPPTTVNNNTEAPNKRKQVEEPAGINDEKETKSTKDTPAADTTTESEEKHFTTIETNGVKEVEMKDAESIEGSVEQGIKEVEMQDAEIVYNGTRVEENIREDGSNDIRYKGTETHPDINKDDTGSIVNVTEGCKEDQSIQEPDKPTKVDVSESNEKHGINANTSDVSGQQVLGEVTTLLKEVQESDARAKLEVEVKVKKLDRGDVKENGQINESTQTAAHVSSS